MTYKEIVRLYEKKDHIIKKTNMTDEQKQEVIDFFTKHREQENQISGDEWNKPELLTYERFKQVMDAFNNRNTKSHANKIANKVGIAGLTEGKDYVDWGEFEDKLLGTFHAYTPLSHLGAKTLAGKTVKPYPEGKKDSASWCIGQTGNDSYWKNYFFKNKTDFLIICGENVPTKKVCFEIKKDYSSTKDVTVWDYYDSSVTFNRLLDIIIGISTIYYNNSTTIEGKNALKNILLDLIIKAKEVSDKLRDDLLKEEEKKKKEEEKQVFIERTQGREVKNFTYRGYDFPMVEMGERAEGKVFGSYYLTTDEVPFSPKYACNKYYYGCNHWDISIVRQWLNSDLPAGQWYKEQTVDGYKVDWDSTSDYTKNFIKNTDGFLKIIGLSKSQLNPVKNVTYTTEGKEIITEDYVWIPSLTELSTRNEYREGEPLDYWKKLLGGNASQDINSQRVMKTCDTLEPWWYWTRSAYSVYSDGVRCVYGGGSISWCGAYYGSRLPVLACFKSQ